MSEEELTVQCCVCHQVREGERWISRFNGNIQAYSHGYCPSCFEVILRELDRSVTSLG
ncbi:MAG: hypothetical protein VCG02_13775 [Verrucomicrobiota bacterium]